MAELKSETLDSGTTNDLYRLCLPLVYRIKCTTKIRWYYSLKRKKKERKAFILTYTGRVV